MFWTPRHMLDPHALLFFFFVGGSDDPRVQTARVTNSNENLSLYPIGKVVAGHSDVDMSQQQEISRSSGRISSSEPSRVIAQI
jgi:hypothetical protein